MANFTGTDDGERIAGSRGDDIIVGLGGDDRLAGGGGNDLVVGGGGADRLLGGRGDDLLVADAEDRLIDGGRGIDVAILGGDTHSFVFGPDNLRGVEGLQDKPGNDSSVTLDLGVLSDTEGGHFTFALGDGDDSVRLLGDDLAKVGDTLVWNDRVILDFEGVERVVAVDGADGRSQVFSLGKAPPHGVADGDVTQEAAIGQSATAKGGDIDQSASIDQTAVAKGGEIDQSASIDQTAMVSGGGHASQDATISQSAVAFGEDSGSHGTEAANDFMYAA